MYKGGSRKVPTIYRPVSLTNQVAKICYKIAKDGWMNHLEENKILTDRQFGFRGGRSCTIKLVSIYSSDKCNTQVIAALIAYT